MRYEYNQAVSPPAPFITIRVVHDLMNTREATVPAKLDTAADMSTIPFPLVHSLTLNESGTFTIEGYDGKQQDLISYFASFIIGEITIKRLEVIPTPENYVLLGRDVLNQLRLLLDGPGLFLEILA